MGGLGLGAVINIYCLKRPWRHFDIHVNELDIDFDSGARCSTYRLVPDDADGQGAADGQLTRPCHGPLHHFLEHGQLLDGPAAGTRSNVSIQQPDGAVLHNNHKGTKVSNVANNCQCSEIFQDFNLKV